MSATASTGVKPLVLRPDQGRHYSMGRMSASFIVDCDETGSRLSVSEWWLESNTVAPSTPDTTHILKITCFT